jgi:transcriptional regulator with XRE-family HTH domain
MQNAGHRLRTCRERLGLTVRDVEAASARIAERHANPEFIVSIGRISEIETKGILPSIFKVYSFAIIYRLDVREILAWYGVDLDECAADLKHALVPNTHRFTSLSSGGGVSVPLLLDPAFDPCQTTNFGRMVQKWGVVPLTFLQHLAGEDYTYGYIGLDDMSMYPLLMPGSFVQVDESRNGIEGGGWASEYERPIYFIETRRGFLCSWCSLKGESIVLQPHPLSPEPVRIMEYPREAEVIGQVVAVAMRLDWRRERDAKPAAPALHT